MNLLCAGGIPLHNLVHQRILIQIFAHLIIVTPQGSSVQFFLLIITRITLRFKRHDQFFYLVLNFLNFTFIANFIFLIHLHHRLDFERSLRFRANRFLGCTYCLRQ